MSFSASSAPSSDERVLDVQFTDDAFSVSLRDGRVITVPLVWYPRLLDATAAQRHNWIIAGGGYGIHWPEVDEDLSTEGLLRGAPAPRGAAKRQERRSEGVETLDRVTPTFDKPSKAKYGYEVEVWERAKAEAIKEIGSQAKRESTITYSDLSQRIHSTTFGPSDYAFHYLLYEISREENAAGRGRISAL